MTSKVHHFIYSGEELSSGPLPLFYDRTLKEFFNPVSRLFFCMHCGEIYARDRVPGASWTSSYGVCCGCSQHHRPSSSIVPGSLLLFPDDTTLDRLPQPVLEREFELHMQWAEAREKV